MVVMSAEKLEAVVSVEDIEVALNAEAVDESGMLKMVWWL